VHHVGSFVWTVLNILVSQRQEIFSAAGGICRLTDAAMWSL